MAEPENGLEIDPKEFIVPEPVWVLKASKGNKVAYLRVKKTTPKEGILVFKDCILVFTDEDLAERFAKQIRQLILSPKKIPSIDAYIAFLSRQQGEGCSHVAYDPTTGAMRKVKPIAGVIEEAKRSKRQKGGAWPASHAKDAAKKKYSMEGQNAKHAQRVSQGGKCPES